MHPPVWASSHAARALAAPLKTLWVIRLWGDFDAHSIHVVERVSYELLQYSVAPVVFDLRQVTFANTALLNHLIALRLHRPVGLVGADRLMRLMIEVSGAALPVFPDLDAALAALSADGAP
ncbi:STAS domain-containing protein [Streptomyces sp. NPDC007903]|uniref:STAS domain-containing protein n=1 Tax=Streptomyces sp. NPDC007903 TaxID=3364786 RepID=UPI0036EB710D